MNPREEERKDVLEDGATLCAAKDCCGSHGGRIVKPARIKQMALRPESEEALKAEIDRYKRTGKLPK